MRWLMLSCNAVLLALTAGCDSEAPAVGAPASPPRTASSAAARGVPKPRLDAISSAEFRRLVTELSEPDSDFITDNYVSNETSYLQIGPLLKRRVNAGGVYLGVGPEQNFTYVALSRPVLAFIVDIRRANLLLHLFYKCLFELSHTREEFLALLFSRPNASSRISGELELAEIIERLRQPAATPARFDETHQAVLDRIVNVHGLELSDTDRKELLRAHRAFFEGQFELAFELKQHSSRRYPSFRELVTATDAEGRSASFLGTESAFQEVARLQRENRIIPVTGDFAGAHALASIAREIGTRRLSTSVFYVSNVEQYLLGDSETWQRWMANLDRLPATDETLLIRAYLDQGRRHPAQLSGQRTATVLQSFLRARELDRERPRDLWQLTTRAQLED